MVLQKQITVPIRALSLLIVFAFTTIARTQDVETPPAEPVSASDAMSLEEARAELEAMRETDQQFRREIVELGKTHSRSSPEVRQAWEKQNATDAHNIERLEKIIAQFGWPTQSAFGKKAASAAFLILQHSGLSYQKKYLPLAKEAAANGEMRASSLALLEDRIRIREGQKQIYGSQVTQNESGEWEPLPVEDEENLDALRASVGLKPIWDYLQSFAQSRGGTVNSKWKKRSETNSDEIDTTKPDSP